MNIFISDILIPYETALQWMEQKVEDIYQGQSEPCLWFLEHPPLITGGTSAKSQDIISPPPFPIHEASRGGQYTYHGPGQQIVYVLVDLATYDKDIKKFIYMLEEWLIRTLQDLEIKAQRRPGRIGIWIEESANRKESKIAALGIRIRKWVTFHGVALNVSPNLEHFNYIVPCGIKEYGVTSILNEKEKYSKLAIQTALINNFCRVFDINISRLTTHASYCP